MAPEDDTGGMRKLLRSAPVPPIRVDVEKAMHDGRRGVRLRRFGTAGGAALAVVLAAGGTAVALRPGARPPTEVPATSPPTAAVTSAPPTAPATSEPPAGTEPGMLTCTTMVLPNPPGTGGIVVRAGDPAGRYVVADAERTVRYFDGVPTMLPLPPRAATVQTNAVNARGEVAGMAVTGSGEQFAWVYRGARAIRLPGLSGHPRSAAYGINARGDVAGIAWNDGAQAAVVWPAASPNTVRRLAAPASATAFDIRDDGTVVGGLGDGVGPYLWNPDGKGHRLPIPPRTSGGKVFAINGDWAVGWASPGGGDAQLAIWNLATGTVTAEPGLSGDAMSAVNAAGDVVAGSAEAARYVLRDGRRYTVPVVGPYTIAEPISVSADGTVLAGNLSSPSGTAGAVWRC